MGQGSPTVGEERTLAGASRDQIEGGRAQPLPVVRSARPGFPCASRRRGVRSPPEGLRPCGGKGHSGTKCSRAGASDSTRNCCCLSSRSSPRARGAAPFVLRDSRAAACAKCSARPEGRGDCARARGAWCLLGAGSEGSRTAAAIVRSQKPSSGNGRGRDGRRAMREMMCRSGRRPRSAPPS